MKRLRTLALAILGFTFLFAFFGGVGWFIYQFFKYIGSVPKELGAALVAAATTIFVATLTVMVGRYYERKKELDALYRDKKTEIYDQFLNEFFGLFYSTSEKKSDALEQDLIGFMREFTRKLVLWSGPEVIEAFVAWKEHLEKGVPDAKSIFMTEALLMAIRNDLRHSNTGLRKGFFAKLFIKEGRIFLEIAEKNPNVTLATLVDIEKAINSKKEVN